MSKEIKRQFLTEAYDKREAFEEIKPLLRQIHDFCQANNIPYLFAANVVVDTEEDSHETVSSALLLGPEVTPPEMAVANIAIQKGLPAAMAVGSILAGAGYSGESISSSGGEDTSFDINTKPTVGGVGHA